MNSRLHANRTKRGQGKVMNDRQGKLQDEKRKRNQAQTRSVKPSSLSTLHGLPPDLQPIPDRTLRSILDPLHRTPFLDPLPVQPPLINSRTRVAPKFRCDRLSFIRLVPRHQLEKFESTSTVGAAEVAPLGGRGAGGRSGSETKEGRRFERLGFVLGGRGGGRR